ncbi:uncharacterized protein MYCFIDRAFT_75876 [Pseudocercospora fijiensis CIRAD86]|uniref:Uncharacterized protein n=1 Tax=Pseudocercospora fijiensis (strain CIRAD86) TaxID=383855 RepID=N1QAM9_PSEFD|nr:uncharacterized protein MYCFIDRAFT_75876 [Pseudocercospora fijiensis CIRAD86]EME88042.1 hypothetical protein MYCFIDRAFT_75876 [Pseudocercospora fijiensis CIRAD86]
MSSKTTVGGDEGVEVTKGAITEHALYFGSQGLQLWHFVAALADLPQGSSIASSSQGHLALLRPAHEHDKPSVRYRDMLNAKALTELLSHNRDERLCRRWYLMTANGTLLSYSVPTDINDLRKHAAMAAISWQEYQHRQDGDGLHAEIREDMEQSPLHALTIESDTSNIIMRRVQGQLLLVLEGGVPPRRADFVKRTTAEAADGTRLRGSWDDGSTSTNNDGDNTNGGNKVAASVVKVQRQKLDHLAEAILAEFEQTGFQMPEDAGSTVF